MGDRWRCRLIGDHESKQLRTWMLSKAEMFAFIGRDRGVVRQQSSAQWIFGRSSGNKEEKTEGDELLSSQDSQSETVDIWLSFSFEKMHLSSRAEIIIPHHTKELPSRDKEHSRVGSTCPDICWNCRYSLLPTSYERACCSTSCSLRINAKTDLCVFLQSLQKLFPFSKCVILQEGTLVNVKGCSNSSSSCHSTSPSRSLLLFITYYRFIGSRSRYLPSSVSLNYTPK